MSDIINKYSLENIEQFLIDYENSQRIPSELMLSIPIIGTKIYRRALLEQMKIDVLKKLYYKAQNSNFYEQKTFISDMAPVLDEFYTNKKRYKNKVKK